MKSRIFFHPVLSNSRSRILLTTFLVTIAAVTSFMAWKTSTFIEAAGLSKDLFQSSQSVPLLSLLMSPYFHLLVVVLATLIAAATTGVSIIGPVKRLEQWLLDWDSGHSMLPLQARTGDPYENLIRLINDLYVIRKPARINSKTEKSNDKSYLSPQ